MRATSNALRALVLVLVWARPAYAHHETAIAEVAAGLGIWVPVAVLGLLGAIDRLRYWWRDGARMSFQARGVRFYCTRRMAGDSWLHAGGDRFLRYAELITPALRFELYY